MGGDALIIKIGEAEFDGRLPHMRWRFLIFLAWRRAMGFRPGDDDDDKIDERGYSYPSEDPDGEDMMAIALAAIGLCWNDNPLDVEDFRLVSRRLRKAKGNYEDRALHEYGDLVYDALFAQHYDPQHLYDAGSELIALLKQSIPTTAEIEDATDPSEAPGEHSIGST